ncbi:thiolase family protein, partial [Zoogloea sp. LCSB751]|uniref:thiolase family protein n=1 Tax=Zoogloea sp. LCSB751 TaxID=1965277 RepID=UPI0009A4F5BA
MSALYIVEAVRTPVGRYKGSLAGVRADHLGAHVLNALLERAGIAAEAVDDVIFGCVTQVGEQSANIARTALLGAGWPVTIPGLTLDRKCGSGEVAVHVAAGLIASGSADVVVAGGAENMSRVRMGGNRELYGEAFGWLAADRYELTSQGEAAERVAEKWQLSRETLDAFALRSHQRAAAAAEAGYFKAEIAPVPVNALKEKTWAEPALEQFGADETIRPDTTAEKLATLKSSFRPEGRMTAGNSSQISDGAAVLLLMSEAAVKRLGVKPKARIRAFTTVGSDPTLMLTGPIAATRKVLGQAGLSLGDIDLYEVNEAFAPVPLMWQRELGADVEKLNVNGGAIALGHPLGASGARIMTSLLHELERRQARYGLQAICCAGGMG